MNVYLYFDLKNGVIIIFILEALFITKFGLSLFTKELVLPIFASFQSMFIPSNIKEPFYIDILVSIWYILHIHMDECSQKRQTQFH